VPWKNSTKKRKEGEAFSTFNGPGISTPQAEKEKKEGTNIEEAALHSATTEIPLPLRTVKAKEKRRFQ